MTSETNKHGLNRYIPEEVRRKIRQAAGFGCVCCGIGIAQYEHIDPEFQDAQTHDPERMAYLCGGCHDKVTRGMWSKEKIEQARRNPWCKKRGKPHDAFDVSSQQGIVWVGPNKIINMSSILRVGETEILAIEPPEAEGLPYQISGKFYSDADRLLFEIDRNEWFGDPSAWDIQCVGPRITIRKEHRAIALQLRAVPQHGIFIEHADLRHRGTHLFVSPTDFTVTSPKNAAFRILGRTIIGTSGKPTLISVDNDDQIYMGGGGSFGMETDSVVPPMLPALSSAEPGRNDPCTCGSGQKFKKCCGRPA